MNTTIKEKERMWDGLRICEKWVNIYKGKCCIECNGRSVRVKKHGQESLTSQGIVQKYGQDESFLLTKSSSTF